MKRLFNNIVEQLAEGMNDIVWEISDYLVDVFTIFIVIFFCLALVFLFSWLFIVL